MPEKPKEECEESKESENERDKSAWSEDQKERSYYYDDAHGYEVFEDKEDDDKDTNGE